MGELKFSEINWLSEMLPLYVGAEGAELDLMSGITKLPFYEGGLLVQFNVAGETEEFLLVGKGAVEQRDIYALTGRSKVIHAVNESHGITITEDTVLDYLRFFCAQIGDENDRFPTVENRSFVMDDDEDSILTVGPLKVLDRYEDSGTFICKGWTLHLGFLFECVFKVTLDGMVLMLNDDGGRPIQLIN